MLDDIDLDIPDEGPPPEESDNRTFILVAGGIGALMLLSLICMAVYFVFFRPSPEDEQLAADQTATAQQSTALAQIDAETATAAAAVTATATETLPPTATEPPPTTEVPPTTEATGTQVVVEPGETEAGPPEAGGPTVDPRTATVQALLTQAAVAQTQAASIALTVTPTATLILPDTGFIDDVGAPGLMAMAVFLIGVIFLVRRLRAVNV